MPGPKDLGMEGSRKKDCLYSKAKEYERAGWVQATATNSSLSDCGM